METPRLTPTKRSYSQSEADDAEAQEHEPLIPRLQLTATRPGSSKYTALTNPAVVFQRRPVMVISNLTH